MISPVCFSKEWLREKGNALQARDVRNLEKCVLALELVGRLKKAGLEFIFKGGNFFRHSTTFTGLAIHPF